MKNLDKEEFRVKLEEINHLVEQKDYKGAMNVVDSIDWRRVKNVRTLCVVGEIYAANKRYEDSKEIFLLAYHRASIGKNILYRLVEVSLKLGQVSEAVEFSLPDGSRSDIHSSLESTPVPSVRKLHPLLLPRIPSQSAHREIPPRSVPWRAMLFSPHR